MNKWNIKVFVISYLFLLSLRFYTRSQTNRIMFKVKLFNVKQNVYLHSSMEIYTIRQKCRKNTDIKNDIRPLYVR